jgi:hypothetical protein
MITKRLAEYRTRYSQLHVELASAVQERSLALLTECHGITVAALIRLREWLVAEKVTHVVMESTGSYWIPIFNILEDHFVVVLANPEEVLPFKIVCVIAPECPRVRRVKAARFLHLFTILCSDLTHPA